LRRAEAGAILFRRQPAMVIRGSWILKLFEKIIQIPLLRRGGFEDQHDVLQSERSVRAPQVVFGPDSGVNVAAQGYEFPIVDGRGYAGLLRLQIGGDDSGK
jgi:hypothetical protein